VSLMKRISSSILFGAIVFCSFVIEVNAEVCLSLSRDKSVMMSVEKSTDSERKLVQATLDNFISTVNSASLTADKIASLYSEKDKSREIFSTQLKGDLDNLSQFKGLSSAKTVQAYRWGNYFVAWNEYTHNGKTMQLVDAFNCDSKSCKMSNIFERPSDREDIFSRWMSLTRNNPQFETCSNSEKAIKIYPTYGDKVNPLNINFNKVFKLKAVGTFNSLSAMENIPSNLKSCLQSISATNLSNLDEVAGQSFFDNLLNSCAVNTEMGAGVPVISMQDKKKIFFSLIAYLQMFKDAKEIFLLETIQDKGHILYPVILKDKSDKFYWAILPIERSSHRYDWSHYGSGLSETLFATDIADYLTVTEPVKNIIKL